jgi:hypothetical protein
MAFGCRSTGILPRRSPKRAQPALERARRTPLKTAVTFVGWFKLDQFVLESEERWMDGLELSFYAFAFTRRQVKGSKLQVKEKRGQ